MIWMENVTKRFYLRGAEKRVADGITAVFPTGVSVALLGRNGAGKSTLLRMVSGEITPDHGEILSDGRISWPVGFAGSFHAHLTGAQNTRFIARVYGIDSAELLDFVEDFAELGPHFHMPFRSYSSGMRSRLAFGVSMGVPFDTYLVDEVTSVGDAVFRKRSSEVFQDRMTHAGAVVVSHSMGMLRELCTAAAVLEDGKLTYYDDLEEGIAHHADLMQTGPVAPKGPTPQEKLNDARDKLVQARAATQTIQTRNDALKDKLVAARDANKEMQARNEILKTKLAEARAVARKA